MQQKLKMVVTGNDQKEKQKFDIVLSTLLFLYCAALPFEEALASSFGSVLRFLGVLIIGYSVCIYCRYRIRIYTLRFLIPFALWMLIALISVLWSEDISWWIYFVQIYLFQFIFVVKYFCPTVASLSPVAYPPLGIRRSRSKSQSQAYQLFVYLLWVYTCRI